MLAQELRDRLAEYARLVAQGMKPLLGQLAAGHAARQAVRASASAAASYRSACLARSPHEFRAKIGLALEESDETVFWLEYLRLTEHSSIDELTLLIAEGHELSAILGGATNSATDQAHLYKDRSKR
jgi:four helix bundle protein